MSAVVETGLSRDEARVLTDEVRGDAERLWRKLVELYDGGAHSALGYPSWATYFKAEFGGSDRRAYQLLDAGRVVKALESHCTPGSLNSLTEKHTRALAPLKNEPDELRGVWEEAMERGDGRPTSALVGEVVAERLPLNRRAELNLNAAKRRLYDGLSSVGGYCTALTEESTLHRALTGASPDDVAAWERLASESVRALNELRRAIKESK